MRFCCCFDCAQVAMAILRYSKFGLSCFGFFFRRRSCTVGHIWCIAQRRKLHVIFVVPAAVRAFAESCLSCETKVCVLTSSQRNSRTLCSGELAHWELGAQVSVRCSVSRVRKSAFSSRFRAFQLVDLFCKFRCSPCVASIGMAVHPRILSLGRLRHARQQRQAAKHATHT